jgi:hypothetical protein
MFRDILDIVAGVLDPDEEDTLFTIFKRFSFSLKSGLFSLLILSSIRNYKLNTYTIKRFFHVKKSNFTLKFKALNCFCHPLNTLP